MSEILQEQLKGIPHSAATGPLSPPITPPPPASEPETTPQVTGTASSDVQHTSNASTVPDDPKWTAFLEKDKSKIKVSYTLKPEKPGESIIVRSPRTPPGTPLAVRPDEATRTCWDLFQNGKKKAGAGAKCMGVRSGEGYKWFSWQEIEDQTRALGLGTAAFANLDFGSRQTVGVFLDTSIEFALVDSMCSSRGFIIVPMYTSFASDALVHIVNLVEVTCVFTTAALLPRLLSIKDRLPKLTHAIIARAERTVDLADLETAKKAGVQVKAWAEVMELGKEKMAEEDKAGNKEKWWWPVDETWTQTIAFTSGTTGMPKGAVITHGCWVAAAAGAEEVFKDFLHPGDSYRELRTGKIQVACNNKFGESGEADTYNTLNLGCSIGYFGGDVTRLFEDMEILKPTYFPTVPRLLARFHNVVTNQISKAGTIVKLLWNAGFAYKRMLLHRFGWVGRTTVWDKLVFGKIQAKVGGNLRGIVVGSAPIPSELLEWYRIVLGCEVLEGYAQTENCAVSMITRPGDYGFPYGSFVGVPFMSNEIKLVDVPEMNYYTTDQPHPRGEFCSRSATTMQCYYKDPKKTEETIDGEGWLHSGDIAELLPDGTFKIIDRMKNVLKLSQGEFVAVERVENVLSRSEFIAQIYLEGSSLKAYLVGIIHPDPDHTSWWASHHPALKDLSYEQLCYTKELNEAIMHDIKRLAKEYELHSFETPKVVFLEPAPFTIENDLLTPTFKNKRPQLKKFYADRVAELYRFYGDK